MINNILETIASMIASAIEAIVAVIVVGMGFGLLVAVAVQVVYWITFKLIDLAELTVYAITHLFNKLRK